MILELGCGKTRQPQSDVAIDKSIYSDADIIRDFAKRGIPFSDNSFDEVLAFDVIEHIEEYEDLIFMFNEIWRVLKEGGIFRFTTPNGIIGFSHLTHHRIFFKGSFEYLIDYPDRKDWQNMRLSDGIVANFKPSFDDKDESVIRGNFQKVV